MDHMCKITSARFCYICGNVVLPYHLAKITDFVEKVYCDFFGVKLGNKENPVAPRVCCKTCVENLRDWNNGKTKSMLFAIPMV